MSLEDVLPHSLQAATNIDPPGPDFTLKPNDPDSGPDEIFIGNVTENAMRDGSSRADTSTYVSTMAARVKVGRPLSFDAVLFFHGINGLELACENKRVPPGSCVLFNGASLLLENAAEFLSGENC